MSSTNPPQGVSDPAQGKGKGKANDPPHDVSMGEEDSSSDEETGAEDEVCCALMATSNGTTSSETPLTHLTYTDKGRA